MNNGASSGLWVPLSPAEQQAAGELTTQAVHPSSVNIAAAFNATRQVLRIHNDFSHTVQQWCTAVCELATAPDVPAELPHAPWTITRTNNILARPVTLIADIRLCGLIHVLKVMGLAGATKPDDGSKDQSIRPGCLDGALFNQIFSYKGLGCVNGYIVVTVPAFTDLIDAIAIWRTCCTAIPTWQRAYQSMESERPPCWTLVQFVDDIQKIVNTRAKRLQERNICLAIAVQTIRNQLDHVNTRRLQQELANEETDDEEEQYQHDDSPAVGQYTKTDLETCYEVGAKATSQFVVCTPTLVDGVQPNIFAKRLTPEDQIKYQKPKAKGRPVSACIADSDEEDEWNSGVVFPFLDCTTGDPHPNDNATTHTPESNLTTSDIVDRHPRVDTVCLANAQKPTAKQRSLMEHDDCSYSVDHIHETDTARRGTLINKVLNEGSPRAAQMDHVTVYRPATIHTRPNPGVVTNKHKQYGCTNTESYKREVPSQHHGEEVSCFLPTKEEQEGSESVDKRSSSSARSVDTISQPADTDPLHEMQKEETTSGSEDNRLPSSSCASSIDTITQPTEAPPLDDILNQASAIAMWQQFTPPQDFTLRNLSANVSNAEQNCGFDEGEEEEAITSSSYNRSMPKMGSLTKSYQRDVQQRRDTPSKRFQNAHVKVWNWQKDLLYSDREAIKDKRREEDDAIKYSYESIPLGELEYSEIVHNFMDSCANRAHSQKRTTTTTGSEGSEEADSGPSNGVSCSTNSKNSIVFLDKDEELEQQRLFASQLHTVSAVADEETWLNHYAKLGNYSLEHCLFYGGTSHNKYLMSQLANFGWNALLGRAQSHCIPDSSQASEKLAHNFTDQHTVSSTDYTSLPHHSSPTEHCNIPPQQQQAQIALLAQTLSSCMMAQLDPTTSTQQHIANLIQQQSLCQTKWQTDTSSTTSQDVEEEEEVEAQEEVPEEEEEESDTDRSSALSQPLPIDTWPKLFQQALKGVANSSQEEDESGTDCSSSKPYPTLAMVLQQVQQAVATRCQQTKESGATCERTYHYVSDSDSTTN